MFAFAATADAVKSHHFDLAYDAYLADRDTRQFIIDNNPAALKEIASRLSEAISRGLWQPRLNSAYDDLKALQSWPTNSKKIQHATTKRWQRKKQIQITHILFINSVFKLVLIPNVLADTVTY